MSFLLAMMQLSPLLLLPAALLLLVTTIQLFFHLYGTLYPANQTQTVYSVVKEQEVDKVIDGRVLRR